MMQEPTPVMFYDIGQMNCWPITITLTENAEPYGVRTTRNTPFSLICEVKAGLPCILEKGIIEDITEPTLSYTVNSRLADTRYNGHPNNTERTLNSGPKSITDVN